MKTSIGELLISIGLDSSKFSNDLKNITHNIKGLEKDIRNMDKSFGDVSNSMTGLESKHKLLSQVLSENSKAINEHIKTRDNYVDMLKKEKEELDKLQSAETRDEKAILQKEKSIQTLLNKYQKEENAIDRLTNKQNDYKKSLSEVEEQYSKLINNVETYDEKLESISKTTSMQNDELTAQQKILSANGKSFASFNKQAEIVENNLKGAIKTYNEHRKELAKSETELEELTKVTTDHRKELIKQQDVLQETLKLNGENSVEYKSQAKHIEQLTKKQIEYEQSLNGVKEHTDGVKESMSKSKVEVASYYEELKQMGSTKLVRGINQVGDTLGKLADKTSGTSAISAGIGTASYAMFSDYENGLSKISTLVDWNKDKLDKTGQDIIEISNNTGTSVNQLMEGTYQALSSLGEVDDMYGLLNTSAKLSTAGFAENKDVVSLLSTAYNTLGSELGSYENTANKLMAVQNLGVTTISELSATMGESLSLASAYNVSFDDICASFIKTTKAGQSTSESATNIARLLEELGDSGSKVSEVLKSKTGKSFTELMDSGENLYSVLQILDGHAKNAGISINELFGSSNAGIGALAILSDEGITYSDALKGVVESNNLLQDSFDKISNTSSFKLQQSIEQLKNSLVSIGGALAPVITSIASVISKFAEYINGLSDGTKSAIGQIIGLTSVLSPLLSIGSKVATTLGNLAEVVGGLKISKVFGEVGQDAGAELGKGVADGAKKANINKTLKDTLGNAGKEVAEEVGEEVGESLGEGIGKNLAKSGAKEAVGEITEEIVETGVQATATKGIFSALWGVISAHPIGAIASLTGAVLALGTGFLIAKTKKEELDASLKKDNAFKAVEVANQYTESTLESIETDKQKVKSLGEIQKEYDALNKKGTANMNTKELERYRELCSQIAKIMPELVVGYDTNGNPIIKQNESLESNIKLLEIKIQREKELAQQQARQASKEADEAYSESTKDYSKKSSDLEVKKLEADKKANGEYLRHDYVNNLQEYNELSDKERTKDLQKQKDYTNSLKTIRDDQAKIAQDRANEIEYLNGIYRNEASVYSECSDVMKNATTDQIAFNESLISSLNFEGLDTAGRSNAIKTIVDTNANMSKENMKIVNDLGQQQQMLDAQLMSGEITSEEYTKQIDTIAKKYAEIYNMDVDTAKKIFVPQLDKSALNALEYDIDYTREKIDQGLKEILATTDNNKRLELVKELSVDPELSDDVKAKFDKMLEDNVISNNEVLELGELVANGEVNTSALQDSLKENLSNFGQLENMTIEMAVQFGDSVETIGEVKTMIDSLDGMKAETKIELKQDIDEKDIQGIVKNLKELPTEKAIGILVGLQQTGEYTPEQLKEIIDGLPDSVKTSLQVLAENGTLPEEIAEDLGLIPPETNATINVDNSQVEQAKKENQEGTTGTHETISDNSEVEQDKASNQQQTSGTHITESDNSAVEQDKANNQQQTSGMHITESDNSAVESAKKQNQKNTSSTHTITVKQIFKNVVDFFTGNSNKRSATNQSLSEPQVITLQASEPQIIDNFASVLSNTKSNIQNTATTLSKAGSNLARVSANSFSVIDTIDTSMLNESITYDIDLLQDYQAQLDRLNDKLELVSKQAENAFGASKARLLKTNLALLEEQQNALHHQANELRTIENNLKSMLASQGFKVDSNGAVTNYSNKILELEKNLESAKKAQDAYEGDNKNTQKSLQDAYDKANERLTKAQDTLNEYYSTSSKIGELSNEWWTLEQSIKDVQTAIERAIIEQNTFAKTLKTEQLEYQYDNLTNKIELLNGKIDVTKDEEKVGLLQQQNSLIDQQQQKLHEVADSYREQMQYYYEYLNGKGFIFDTEGNIYNQRLEEMKNESNYEAIKEAYDMYVELHSQIIPGLSQEWWDLESEQQNVKESIDDINKELEETARELAKEREELEHIKQLDVLEDLIHQQGLLESQLDTLDAKLELTYGSNKTTLFREKIDLINEQMSALQDVNNELERQQQYLQGYLGSKGFTFLSDGDIRNFDDLLNTTTTKEEYDELKSLAEEYMDVQNQLADNDSAWYDLQTQIRDTQFEITLLKDELKQLISDTKVRELTAEFQLLENELEMLQNMSELSFQATGRDLKWILERQTSTLERQKDAIEEQIDFYKNQAVDLGNILKFDYSFEFDDNGTIKDAESKIESLKNSLSEDEFDRVNQFLEDYYALSFEQIPQLENEMLGLQKAIEDIEEEKLDKAKDIEDKITEMIEDQTDKRIKAIEEERDARIEELEDMQERYQKWREDIDYEDDYNKQLEKVQELQTEIEIAKRDDSLSGKARLEKLLEELKDEQENLEELVQDRTDKLINDMFQDKQEQIESETERRLNDLEEIFSETNIAQMVANAMQTGVFEDLEGNVVSLDQALLDFTNNSADAIGVLGNTIREELLENLDIALDYMSQMKDISVDLSNIDYSSAKYQGVGYGKTDVEGTNTTTNNTTTNNDNSKTINVEFNPTIEITGSAEGINQAQITEALLIAKSEIINEMEHKILSNMK